MALAPLYGLTDLIPAAIPEAIEFGTEFADELVGVMDRVGRFWGGRYYDEAMEHIGNSAARSAAFAAAGKAIKDFRGKKRKKGDTSSQLPARGMPSYTGPGRGRKRGRNEVQRIFRRMQRLRRSRKPVVVRGAGFKATYPGVKPVRGIPTSRKVGKFRKAKKIRTAPSKYAKRHYDDYGSLERDHCAYIGFQRHGCKDRMWSIVGEALTKALLAKVKVYPRSYDEKLMENSLGLHYDKLEITYKRVSVPGGVDDTQTDTLTVSSTMTFEELAAAVADSVESHAEHTFATDTEFAYYPTAALWYNSAGAPNRWFHRVQVSDIGDSIIELYATQVITIKNLTPNDSGTSDLDVVGVNPIHGKKYEFNNFRPKLIDMVRETHNDLDAFHQVDDTNGINTSMTIAGAANSDHVIAHPPAARQLFTNCVRATPVSMGAGGVKVERTTFKMKHKLSTLIERIYYNQYDKGSFGGCTFFAFERKTRSVTGESRVKISFDRALHMSAHCKLAVKKTMLKHYDNNAIGAIADA